MTLYGRVISACTAMLLLVLVVDICLGQYCSDAEDETQCLNNPTFVDLKCGYGTGLTNQLSQPYSLCQPCDFFETGYWTSGYLLLAEETYNESTCNALTNCLWNADVVHPLAATYPTLPQGVCEYAGAPAPTALWEVESPTSVPSSTATTVSPSASPTPPPTFSPTVSTVPATLPPTFPPTFSPTASATEPVTEIPTTTNLPPNPSPTAPPPSSSDNRDTLIVILVPIGILVPLVALYVHNRMARSVGYVQL